MTTAAGSVTIHGASGISSVLSITNDAFGLGLASSFQSLTAQLDASPSAFPSLMSGSSFYAIEDNLGNEGVSDASGVVTVLGSDGSSLDFNGPIDTGTSVNAVIVGGNGNDSVSTGQGSDTVALGTGHNAIVIGQNGSVDSAGTDTVFGGYGVTTVTVSGANSFIASSELPGASLNVDNSGGTSTEILAVTNTTITGASASVTNVVGYGPTTVTAGAGGTNDVQTGGTLRLYGLSGEHDTISANSGQPDTLYGANGTVINFSGSSNDNVFVANDTLHGGTGTAEFDASSSTGNNQFWAGSGNATLIGGTGRDTLVAGHGASTLTGGSGAANEFDLFSVNGGASTSVTITDFNAASGNHITLFGYGANGVSYALGHQAQTPTSATQTAGTTISLNDGSKIFLTGVTSNVAQSAFLSTEPSA